MLIGIGIVGGAMSAVMRSETIVEKFKTIERNFAMIVVNCARTGVSLDKIYATAAGRGEIEQDRRELANDRAEFQRDQRELKQDQLEFHRDHR